MKIIAVKGIQRITFTSWTFPGGELGVKLDALDFSSQSYRCDPADHQTLIAWVQSAADIIELALVKDALVRFAGVPVDLVLPYVPYARQDRVCDPGESFSILVFADLIRAMGFRRITIFDPHSSVTEAALRPDKVYTQFDIINYNRWFNVRVMKNRSVILAPDAGAAKKLSKIAQFYERPLVIADKERDPATGKILKTVVPLADFDGQDVVIIDDICDGGRTFIELAQVLREKNIAKCIDRNVGKIILYVTHGIFSKGLHPLYAAGIDEIYTTDTFASNYNHDINTFNAVGFFILGDEPNAP